MTQKRLLFSSKSQFPTSTLTGYIADEVHLFSVRQNVSLTLDIQDIYLATRISSTSFKFRCDYRCL